MLLQRNSVSIFGVAIDILTWETVLLQLYSWATAGVMDG
jgi:hypothetical protein